MASDKLSTTAIAKARDLEPSQLFTELSQSGYINRYQDKWVLTELGKKFGGEYVDHKKFGRFIVWPSNLVIDDTQTTKSTLSATQIGERVQLSAKKVNQMLLELGWIQKVDQGWHLTHIGAAIGAQQRNDKNSGNDFVVWHPSILRNKRFMQSIREFRGEDAESTATDKSISSFRQKFEAKHRTLDGHYVNTKSELLIDNWLYLNGIVHAYHRELPVEQDFLTGFYLPSGQVYIHYWDFTDLESMDKASKGQRQLYLDIDLELIDVFQNDVENLDSYLPSKLKPYGIKSY